MQAQAQSLIDDTKKIFSESLSSLDHIDNAMIYYFAQRIVSLNNEIDHQNEMLKIYKELK